MKNYLPINPRKAAGRHSAGRPSASRNGGRHSAWVLPFLTACLAAGCYPDPDFPVTPQITYLDIKKTTLASDNGGFGGKQDRIVISIDYQDGDGDLGLLDSQDTTRNYRLRLFLKRQGVFQEVIRRTIDPKAKKETRLDYQTIQFPLKSDGKPGPIEGTIDCTVNFSHDFSIAPPPSNPIIYSTPNNDTIYFRVQILDRQQHLSNEVETLPVIINQK